MNQVQETFADFQAINDDLFSLEIASGTAHLSGATPQSWTVSDSKVVNRIVDGLFGVLMATRTSPLIRFDNNSSLCATIAESLQNKMDHD